MDGWREGGREGERRATLVTKKVVTAKRESDIVAKRKGGRVLLKCSTARERQTDREREVQYSPESVSAEVQ